MTIVGMTIVGMTIVGMTISFMQVEGRGSWDVGCGMWDVCPVVALPFLAEAGGALELPQPRHPRPRRPLAEARCNCRVHAELKRGCNPFFS